MDQIFEFAKANPLLVVLVVGFFLFKGDLASILPSILAFFKPKPYDPVPAPAPTPAPAPSPPADRPIIDAILKLLPTLLPLIVPLLSKEIAKAADSDKDKEPTQ